MNKLRNIFFILLTASTLFWMSSCQAPGVDSTGSEYMPDMAHSIAYEANVFNYYFLNTWDSASVVKVKDMSVPREPVAGTVPRGYTGIALATSDEDRMDQMEMMTGQSNGSFAITLNGHVPYHYEDTEEERERAKAEIIDNPFPITDSGIEIGKNLYDINCGICHGEKGDGAGYLVRDPNPATGDEGGKYPAQPANFLIDPHLNSTNGHYYHAIMYGKNVMGGYADKLSFEERWLVIHYIRSLQADETGAEYNQDANTLNPSFGVPGADYIALAAAKKAEAEAHHGDEHHDDDHHGDEHHDEGSHDSDHHDEGEGH